MFATQLLIGTALLVLMIIIHAVVLDRLIVFIGHIGPSIKKISHYHNKTMILIIAVCGVFFAHIFEMWVWALFYLVIDALPSFEEALYFSTTTFTTVGYGDIVLDEDWRLISAFQSAIGFILFGWSTAFIFEVMNKLYAKEKVD